MKMKFKFLPVICLTILVSCKSGTQPKPNTTYKVMEVTLTDKSLTSNYSATIQGRQTVEIRPQVSGTITKICIDEGAVVKEGQSLFIIDQVPYQAALATAMANVKSAQAQVATAQLMVNSKEELFKQNVVSDYDLQTAKNNLLVAQAALAQAQAQELTARNNLSYTVVKSPATGVAGMIPYRVGALVNSAIVTPLVTVSDDTEMYVYFSMTENQVLALYGGDGSKNDTKVMPEVKLRLSNGTMYDQVGKIDAISGMIDPTTGSISIRATFPNKNGVLRNGGAGNIVFPYEKKDCIAIPQTATYEIQDKTFTYKVIDGKAVSTPITVFGVNDGKEYIVETGLAVGDHIVAEGAGLLRDGAEVTLPTVKPKEE